MQDWVERRGHGGAAWRQTSQATADIQALRPGADANSRELEVAGIESTTCGERRIYMLDDDDIARLARHAHDTEVSDFAGDDREIQCDPGEAAVSALGRKPRVLARWDARLESALAIHYGRTLMRQAAYLKAESRLTSVCPNKGAPNRS